MRIMKDAFNPGSIQFDYFSSNYKQFEEDFYTYANVDVPLTFLTDDLLQMMVSTGKNYFRLNKSHAKDHRDHYFFFEMNRNTDNKNIKQFSYLGHRKG